MGENNTYVKLERGTIWISGHTEPYLYGPLIDRLGELEDQAERADDQDQEEMQKNGDRQKNPIFF